VWKFRELADLWNTANPIHWVAAGWVRCWVRCAGGSCGLGYAIFFTFRVQAAKRGHRRHALMLSIGARVAVRAGAPRPRRFLSRRFLSWSRFNMFITRKKSELPFGAVTEFGGVFLMRTYCPIAARMGPGFRGRAITVQN